MEIPAVNGTYQIKTNTLDERFHDLAVNTKNVSAGSITITARKHGANYFEALPDNVVNLASPHSILFEGTVVEYKFVLTGVAGAGPIEFTDTATGGR